MATWLDEFTFRIGHETRKSTKSRHVDVVDAMAHMANRCVEILHSKTLAREVRLQARFIADLLPFYDGAFGRMTAIYQISPALGCSISGPLSAGDQSEFLIHLSERQFTYIDCPPGAFPLVANVEVQAIFLQSAIVTSPSSPQPPEPKMTAKAVIGTNGIPSPHWLGWTWGEEDIVTVQSPQEEMAFPPQPPLTDLIDGSAANLMAITRSIERAATSIVAYARHQRGTSMIGRLPRIPPKDLARRKRRPHQVRSLFEVLVLKGPHHAGGLH